MPKLYNANDGLIGRDGGPYLDRVEAERAEEQRAKVEKREPDYDNPGGYAGTVYVTASQLLASESVNNLPSQFEKATAAKEKAVEALVEDSDTDLVVSFDAPDVPVDDGKTADERQEFNEKALEVKEPKAKTKSTESKGTTSTPTTPTTSTTKETSTTKDDKPPVVETKSPSSSSTVTKSQSPVVTKSHTNK